MNQARWFFLFLDDSSTYSRCMPSVPAGLKSCLARGGTLSSAVKASLVRSSVDEGWYAIRSQRLAKIGSERAAVAVRLIGWTLQFEFAWRESAPFQRQRASDRKSPNPQSAEWINLRGDKTWPCRRPEWAKITLRGWLPPIPVNSRAARVSAAHVKKLYRNVSRPSPGRKPGVFASAV
jgi:hypothetical protein